MVTGLLLKLSADCSFELCRREHRFPAPSLKEGCRKPVLGVCCLMSSADHISGVGSVTEGQAETSAGMSMVQLHILLYVHGGRTDHEAR